MKSVVTVNPMQDYQTQSDVEALQRANEVKSDPKRHAKAKAHAKKKLAEHDQRRKSLAKVAARSKKIGKGLMEKM